MRSHEISNRRPEKFVSCRVGLEIDRYHEDIARIIRNNNIGDRANFVLTPIASTVTPTFYDNNHCDKQPQSNREELLMLPDLVVPPETWETQVAISIGRLASYSNDTGLAIERFDKLFRHALYLPSPVVVIDCPETSFAQESVANIVNKNLEVNATEKLILFRTSLGLKINKSSSSSNHPRAKRNEFSPTSKQDELPNFKNEPAADLTPDCNSDSGHSISSESQDTPSASQKPQADDWNVWNDFRAYLKPDHRIGLCLAIQDDLENQNDNLARWCGEPIRMVILGVDRFNSKKGFRNTMRPARGVKDFLLTVALANSLKISFVIEAYRNGEIREHLNCLANFCDILDQEHVDDLRAWNDLPLSPLQPLSCNLDSTTYQVFEADLAKYSKYHEAMMEALDSLMMRQNSVGRTKFTIMILGAGRGPLVSAMISAIHKLNLWAVQFKIYALDKNSSSIASLKYKKRRNWDVYKPNINVEVVEADMRVWEPSEKADIIATELLGSFSDNELSPECIDCTWRFATNETISIPESYSSFLAPICSYKMLQELYKSRFYSNKTNVHDQLQVVRLSNYYTISEPKELFTFTHTDLSKKPEEGSNRREATLRFFSKVDTVCHGFAGYFSARLFGSTMISTVPAIKTPTMESWFAAFIPIDNPIPMPASTCLEVRFYRKDSHDKVWYEWMIMKPDLSRLHSPNGSGTAMSKII